tara:strand:- start:1129 stop:2010 length:882 start_codon:yes stop_codon:yes gene_type:complete
MWFDIIRKKVVNMQVVKDIMHHLDGIFHYTKSMPNKIKNSKFNAARSTYNYIRNNMYVIEYDEWYEERAPRVRESEAYSKRFEKVLKELTEWYNSIPRETKKKSKNIFREINKELNAAKSLFLDSDFVFEENKPYVFGTYYRDKDTSTVNLPGQKKRMNPKGHIYPNFSEREEEKLIQNITDTLTHEYGHQASRSIDSPTRGDSFYEEMLAYLVEYPNDKQKAFESWLQHPHVKESVQRDVSGRKRELYDDIKMATKSGIVGKRNPKLYINIMSALYNTVGPGRNRGQVYSYN